MLNELGDSGRAMCHASAKLHEESISIGSVSGKSAEGVRNHTPT